IATLHDYQMRREATVADLQRRVQDPQERQRLAAQAGEMTYAAMFRELLLESRADQLGIGISEAQVDAAIGRVRENFNLKTEEELQAALASSGMTMEQLREQIRSQQRLDEARRRDIEARVQIEEEDLRRYYRKNLEQFRQPEQLQLREVVVLEEGGAPAEERARIAAEIRAKVAGGASLADAIAGHAPTGATSNVIELGWVSPGDLDKSLETAVWTLQKGAISEPVAARGGLHLVQVIDRRESRVSPFAEVSAAIANRERERVFREEFSKYMAELEQKALIVANPPTEAAGFRRLLATEEAAAEAIEGLPEDTGSTPPDVAPPTGSLPASPATSPPPGGQPGSLPTPKPVDPNPAPTEVPPPSPPPPGN
ncbi:MAG TPA: peptidyl-prolyl cis-trans isomerase, partial [Thermoanaerobaculia bacterium]|nr:peptidyl-prolyl cis-trans isomerase [Thermoanaerobaculia bacterium]